MSFYRLKRLLKEYRESIGKKNKSIGSVIKHYRKERNMTLEETSDGICSISYLCKVENNQLIPSDKILPNLLSRLTIKEEEIDYNRKSDWILDIVKTGNVTIAEFNEVKNKTDYQSKLVSYAYHILNKKEMHKAIKLYLELTEYFIYFSDQEMVFFLFLVMYNYYNKEQYNEVILVYKELIVFQEYENVISLKAKLLMMKALYKLNRTIDIKNVYKNLIFNLLEYNYIEEIMELKNYQLSLQARSLETKKLDEIISNLKTNDKLNINYIWFNHFYFYRINYESAYFHIKKIARVNEHFYIMYLITLDKLDKKEEINDALKSNIFENSRYSYKLVREYLGIKYGKPGLKEFIKNEIVYSKFITDEVVIVDYLFNEANTVFKKEHFYKDTVTVLEKQNERLKEKNKVIL
ncbi:MAG: helix-turn-helix transcriptional regulator [Acholeplasma sp.]|nr:helix-turn-helix transcriptional regulator [Acholeplasma sp.]